MARREPVKGWRRRRGDGFHLALGSRRVAVLEASVYYGFTQEETVWTVRVRVPTASWDDTPGHRMLTLARGSFADDGCSLRPRRAAQFAAERALAAALWLGVILRVMPESRNLSGGDLDPEPGDPPPSSRRWAAR